MKVLPYLPKRIWLFILFCIAIQKPAFCQLIIPNAGQTVRHHVLKSMGLDPLWVASIGYRQLLSSQDASIPFYLGGSLKMAPLIISQGAFRANFSQSMEHQVAEKWHGIVYNELYLVHNSNRAGSMYGLGFDLQSAMVHFGRTWTKGIQLGIQHTALTYIRHSEESKDTFKNRYPIGIPEGGPVDGWYGNTASRFSIGFLSRHRLGEQLALQLGFGSLFSFQNQGILLGFSHAQVPLYLRTLLVYSL